jgi:K+:H+ antiporter
MSLSGSELAHVLLAIGSLLALAHTVGHLADRAHQPRVIGEIVGGLLLGPTLLGAIAPGFQAAIFPVAGPLPVLLDAVYQLGLILLMFSAGAELRGLFRSDERKATVWITVIGMVAPLAIGAFATRAVDLGAWEGRSATGPALAIVFSIAIAITSIPVIARIMMDLGIIETPFARIVLGVAVIEDVVLYVLLAIALGISSGPAGDQWGLPVVLGIGPGTGTSIAYHVLAQLVFVACSLSVGASVYRSVGLHRLNPVKRGNPIGLQLVFLFAMCAAAIWLGVVPFFGAFVAGLVVSTSSGSGAARARERIKEFSFAFFVPIYFAIVGLRLDLVHHFQPLAFLAFCVFACVVKSWAVYVGARLGGEERHTSRDLAVALNARGGPGIVLASVALDAKIISSDFYSVLVMLAVLTSFAAGSWLGFIVRAGRHLRGSTDAEVVRRASVRSP